jgi:hypothetical protein
VTVDQQDQSETLAQLVAKAQQVQMDRQALQVRKVKLGQQVHAVSLDLQAHLDLQARQAQVLLDQQDLQDQQDHQVDQRDQQVRQAQMAQQDLQVLVDQQVQTVQQVQQVLRLLFPGRPVQLDHKVLQLTLEDQLQLQRRYRQQEMLSMTRTSLTQTVIFMSGTELPGKALDRLLVRRGQ